MTSTTNVHRKVIDLAGRTHHYWHTFVPFVEAGQLYAYRAHGPYAPEKGLRFDADKVLLDPYGKCVARPSRATALKSVLADPGAYDWEDDRPPRTPFAKTIIYELHVGNFTRHPNSGIRDEPARHVRRDSSRSFPICTTSA